MIRFSRRRGGRPRAAALFGEPASAPPRRGATLGDDLSDPVTLQVRQVQNALVRAGYDIGPTGVDGRWGPRTEAAFYRFVEGQDPGLEGRVQVDTRVSPQVVLMEQPVWNALANAPPGLGGERQSRRTSSSSTTTTTTSTSSGAASDATSAGVDLGEESEPWYQSPWLWGGVALVAAAGVAYVATRPTEEEPELDDEELLPAF